MSYERGIAAFNLQMPDEIPHTQYITHPRWLEYVQKKQNKPNAGWTQLLDFDYVWSVDGPSWNRGRWTDMGHAIYIEAPSKRVSTRDGNSVQLKAVLYNGKGKPVTRHCIRP